MTKNEKFEAIAKLELESRKLSGSVRIGYFWVFFYLMTVTGVNVLASYLSLGIDPVGMFLSGIPALSLFVTSGRIERYGVKGWFGAIFLLSAAVSGFVSWWHTFEVLTHYGHNVWIAAIFPIILDVPMVLLAKSIMDDKARIAQIGHEVQMLLNAPQRASSTPRANRTSATKSVEAPKTPRTRAKSPEATFVPVTA